MKTRKRVGRPTTAAREGEKAALGIRATPSLKRRLQEASEATGRSLSAEAEFRLERSFAVEDALAGPMRPVLLHLVSAFGAEGDPHDPASYRAGMIRAVAALADRFPGELTEEEANLIMDAIKTRVAAPRR